MTSLSNSYFLDVGKFGLAEEPCPCNVRMLVVDNDSAVHSNLNFKTVSQLLKGTSELLIIYFPEMQVFRVA